MDVTLALEARAAGDSRAASRLVPVVYDQLRRIAAKYLRQERAGHTLCPTDLVHEAYIRLVDDERISWQGKTHFLAIAAREMRRILVDSARAHKAGKRGGGCGGSPSRRAWRQHRGSRSTCWRSARRSTGSAS